MNLLKEIYIYITIQNLQKQNLSIYFKYHIIIYNALFTRVALIINIHVTFNIPQHH